ncbi:transposase, partial [Bradyrhizobium sp. CCBAU 11361]
MKSQIAAESLEPGAVVTDVACRHGCRPQQVHDWRRRARLASW